MVIAVITNMVIAVITYMVIAVITDMVIDLRDSDRRPLLEGIASFTH